MKGAHSGPHSAASSVKEQPENSVHVQSITVKDIPGAQSMTTGFSYSWGIEHLGWWHAALTNIDEQTPGLTAADDSQADNSHKNRCPCHSEEACCHHRTSSVLRNHIKKGFHCLSRGAMGLLIQGKGPFGTLPHLSQRKSGELDDLSTHRFLSGV